MREIVLDTETTGLNPLQGDRIVEIGCVELFNRMPTGKIYHAYYNPERSVPQESVSVHGLTDEFLADKPTFAEEVDKFLAFIKTEPLVIHNASFDMGFINAELGRLGFPALPMSRAVDTMILARKKFPGAPASLDALCKRFDIDLSEREMHGALLDARLLSGVYLELCGGRQPGLAMEETCATEKETLEAVVREYRMPRNFAPTEEEFAAHQAFLEQIKNPLWKRQS